MNDADLHLVVAGRPSDDEVRSRITKAAASDPRIHLRFGFLPDEDVARYVAAADAVTLPYSSVLTSSSAMLAMSLGRAVIAPRMGCLPELVGDEGGELYETPTELGDAIQRALGRDLHAIGRQNRERVANLGWDAVAESTSDLYRTAGRLGRTARPEPTTIAPDPWTERLRRARDDLAVVLLEGAELLLADGGELGSTLMGDRPWQGFQGDGGYGGPPGADDAAGELARAEREGIRYLVFAWPAFWWLDAYPGFARQLRRTWRRVLRTDRVAIYELLRSEQGRRLPLSARTRSQA
jgi:hypothetical protein